MLQVFIAAPVTPVFLVMKGFFLCGLLMKVWKRSRAPSDDLPDIEDLHLLFSHERSLPEIMPHTSLEVDLAHLLRDIEENQILEFCMSKVTDVQNKNYSSESDSSCSKSR
jgi:hypothetical protein